jgi:hypothetical protein
MPDTVFDAFAAFFDDLPDIVRRDLSFLMVMLADEADGAHDATVEVEVAARALFRAQTRLGRVADLLKAAAICDVYFALETGERFGAGSSRRGRPPLARATAPAVLRQSYIEQRDAIETARQRWQSLRAGALAAGAIGAAMLPAASGRADRPQPDAQPI